MSLSNKIVLVTGGGCRVGSILVKAFASQGAEVIIHYNSSEQGAFALRKALKNTAKKTHCIQQDLAKKGAHISMAEKIHSICDRIDIVVNNASLIRQDRFTNLDETLFNTLYQINVAAPILLLKSLLPYLAKSPDPQVINITDPSSQSLWKEYFSYSFSQMCLATFTQAIVHILPKLRCNALSLDPTLKPDDMPMQTWRSILEKNTPCGKPVTERTITEAIIGLASNTTKNGEIISVRENT